MNARASSVASSPDVFSTFADWLLRKRKSVLFLVFAAGIVSRSLFCWHPADYRSMNSWREADYAQISRSFYREGMNILYPRVDWRGDGPGFVEMEFPFLPWTTAFLYQVMGYNEIILRVLSAGCSIGALFVFWRLAAYLLDRLTAVVALALFTGNGLLMSLSGAIQPEPLEILLTLLAGLYAFRWHDTDAPRDFYTACFWTSLAILSKSPAAHLGFLLAFFALRKSGLRALLTPTILLGAVIALVPSVVWYGWAHHLYLTTELSLGLSNETHFLNEEMLIKPFPWIASLARLESRQAFGYVGVIPAGIAFFAHKNLRGGLSAWFAAVVVFYVVTADSSADSWAYYYHSISVAPASLLMAFGIERMSGRTLGQIGNRTAKVFSKWFAVGLFIGVAILSFGNGISLLRHAYNQRELQGMYECLREFAPYVPPSGKIVIRGGTKFDPHRHPVAYNESMAFLWMDRRGFNYAQEDYSYETLSRLSARGAEFWIAGDEDLRDTVVYNQIRDNLTSVASCNPFRLFKLAKP